MPNVCRLGDECTGHGCWPPRPNAGASGDVFVNGRGAHRVGDAWAAHTCPEKPDTHAGVQATGAAAVHVNGRRLARVGDAVSCGSAVAGGSSDVVCGDNAPQPLPPPRRDPEGEACSVEIVPPIMRNKGWPVAAALLERWFAGPANDKALDGEPDTSTVPLDWVLSFPRARIHYDRLLGRSGGAPAWLTTAAMSLLQERLVENGVWDGGAFNPFAVPLPEAHRRWYVQTHRVETAWYQDAISEIDELDAALHNFAFHLFPVGKVSVLDNRIRSVVIDGVGVYMRDNFDFGGGWNIPGLPDLGSWGLPDRVSKSPLSGLCPITNEMFRGWRRRHGRGHDYLVFSDVRYVAEVSPVRVLYDP
ncbi:DUF6402 family protein [Azospirillum agricola]|uniref:DUF6402 family protein n=1 Tax=Azospirillum agricola TaxID=1720247 RepID=UPI000A0F1543|nr:DUF6402 family protein [Azospirillum agricola]SMH59456.1 Zn-binding Pro-Ala-Ala-Arg (PAAR) domain-containing protein, incolved in TypeVI secretion [Azospirillum lipoferum]